MTCYNPQTPDFLTVMICANMFVSRLRAYNCRVISMWLREIPRRLWGVSRRLQGVPRRLRGTIRKLRGIPRGLRGIPRGLRGTLRRLRGTSRRLLVMSPKPVVKTTGYIKRGAKAHDRRRIHIVDFVYVERTRI
jgi:hypothetical protein